MAALPMAKLALLCRHTAAPLLLALSLLGAEASTPAGTTATGQLVVVPTPAGSGAFAYTKLEDGVQVRAGAIVRNVLLCGPDIVRVNSVGDGVFTVQPSLVVLPQPGETAFAVSEDAAAVWVRTSVLEIRIAKATGALEFRRADGGLISREDAAAPVTLRRAEIAGAPTYEAVQRFMPAVDESLYGLGQYDEPCMDYRGRHVLLVQTNIGIVVPFLLSTRCYGILWDIYSKSEFDDGVAGMRFTAESAPGGADYYLIAGETMDGVIAGYRRLTGAAPMFPKSAFGLWMSKERYKTQARLLEVVRAFRTDRFPLDNIVQDWQYWGGAKDGTWSGMIWDRERFPDPRGLTRELHDELHVKLMNSIWPAVGDDTALAHELDAKGLRYPTTHWISGHARIYDAYSAEGRAIYFDHVKKGLLDVGVDALWMDGTEIEVASACHDPAKVEADIKGLGRNALGDFTRYLNTYSLVTTKGVYEGQRATGDKRVLTLTRSAFAGQQRYAALAWSGDTTASWRTLRQQIAGGLNVAMAGQPYWTQDTGGFFVPFEGGERNPEYRELFVRWNQFAVFNPLYRIHGTDIEREPQVFRDTAPEIYGALRAATELRYRLLPYIYGLAWRSTRDGYTMMRGLAMDFPDEQQLRRVDDTYLFGPAFLVHPVTRAMFHVSPPPAATVPAEVLHTTDGRPGLAFEYFTGTDLVHSVSRGVDPKVDYRWAGPPLEELPGGLTSTDNFSGRWEGMLVAPEEGEYELGVEADDGVRLWLDGTLVVDDWSEHALRYTGQQVVLRRGQQVAVKIEYYQGLYGRGLRFAWRTPPQLAAAAAAPKAAPSQPTLLPAGCDWYDFWSNDRASGGGPATMDCPLDRFPLYVRAGSIVPLSPVMQYATECPAAPYEIRIYPGADARFTLHEDDNETYAYEQGAFADMELEWHDAARKLVVGARQGAFPGLVPERELRIVLVRPGHGAGVDECAEPDRVIRYRGERVEVEFSGQ